MEIKVQAMKRCTLVTLSGELDQATAPKVEKKLLDLIEAGNRNLVLNLSDVTYISSAGLRTLMAAQIRTRRKTPRGIVVFSELPPHIARTFELVGFHQLFECYETDAQAAGKF